MTPPYILRVMGEGGAARRLAADYSGKRTMIVSRIVDVGGQFLFSPLYLNKLEKTSLY